MKNTSVVLGTLLFLAGVLGLAWFFPPETSGVPYVAAIGALLAPASTSSPVAVSQYKIITNADQCKLNQYAAQGWTLFQIGTVGPISNPDPGCRIGEYGFGIDWAVLEKDAN
jgi:hypothetical protein